MIDQHEVPDIDKYGDILLSTIESVFPEQSKTDNYRERVLSGDPEEVYGRCGYAGSVDGARKLSKQFLEEIEASTSGHTGTNGHLYYLQKERDLILDATAGQFIPRTSRVGYEKYFKGNMFIGDRKTLKQICLKGVINTSTKNNPELSFQRIWGDESQSRMPKY